MASESKVDTASIGLCNPKSAENVGAVRRAAGCYGLTDIYYTGERFERAAKYQLHTNKQQHDISMQPIRSFELLKTPERKLVCVELVEGAQSLPEFCHPEHAVYVFGPEDGSIYQSLIDVADAVVYIPTFSCMNLAASVNVVLYDRLAKKARAYDAVEWVRKTRDANNRLKMKNA